MTTILYLEEKYADTLLALGIAAAFDVIPQYHGAAYSFPEEGDEPIRFPAAALEGEDLEPPFTYHRFKSNAISAFAGRALLQKLEAKWNEFQPSYAEIREHVFPVPTMTDWNTTRFASGGLVGAATFRPLAMKGFNKTKANGLGALQGINEFWLLDALRAIGFLTYAQPKLYRHETQQCRWQVFVPVLPVPKFCDRMLRIGTQVENAVGVQAAAHLFGAELEIPRIEVCQYAELNPLARTVFKIFTLQPNALSATAIYNLRNIAISLQRLHRFDALPLEQHLLKTLDGGDHRAMSKLAQGLARWHMTRPDARIHLLTTKTIGELMTCDKVAHATE